MTAERLQRLLDRAVRHHQEALSLEHLAVTQLEDPTLAVIFKTSALRGAEAIAHIANRLILAKAQEALDK